MAEEIDTSFSRIVQVDIEDFVTATNAFGVEVMTTLASLVRKAFEAEYVFILKGLRSKKPANEEDLKRLAEPVFIILKEIQALWEMNRHVGFNNHLATVAESVMALNWITLPKTPVQFIREMRDAGNYYGIRVLSANKGDQLHINWMNIWKRILGSLEDYVKRFHPTGFCWTLTGMHERTLFSVPNVGPLQDDNLFGDGESPPRPPLGPPGGFMVGPREPLNLNRSVIRPPIQPENMSVMDPGHQRAADHSALMTELSQGVDIVRKLKPVNRVTASQRKDTDAQKAPAQVVAVAKSHPSFFGLDGRRWRVEFHTNVHNLVVTPDDMSQSLAMYQCANITIEVKAKMNAVSIDNCKKSTIFLQDIISSVELIRCQGIEIHCLGNCCNVNIDNCDCVQVFLNDASANCEIITSKTTSTNVCRLTDNGDYVEHPVPEQIKCMLMDNKLQASVVDHSK